MNYLKMSRKYLTAKVTNEKKMLTSNWIREILNLLSNKTTSNQKFGKDTLQGNWKYEIKSCSKSLH